MYKNSRSTVLLPLVVAAAVALGIFLGQFLGRSSAESDIKGILRSLALPQNKVSQTLSLIETQYVDSVAIDSLVERALPVIVSELDPHSVYIPASEMAEINEPLDGEFDGIGVVFNMATDTVIVLNVIPSGPSDKAGVVAGDRIVRINDSLVAGQQIAQREIMRRLRGKRGSEVRLGLERRGIDELVEVTVVRDKIPIRSLTAALMLTGDIAFVKLDQFARTSHTELLEALSTLRTQGMRKLILDLRGNSGGFLDQAIAIANEFLPADKLIVYTATTSASNNTATARAAPPTSTWRCSSTREAPRRAKSSPERCRTTTAERSSAAVRSARGSSNSRFPTPTVRRCG